MNRNEKESLEKSFRKIEDVWFLEIVPYLRCGSSLENAEIANRFVEFQQDAKKLLEVKKVE